MKKSLSRLTNEMLQPDSDVVRLRGAVYAINALIAAHKADQEAAVEELERRIEIIEQEEKKR